MNPYRQVISKLGLTKESQGQEFSWLYVLLSVLADEFDDNPHALQGFNNPAEEVKFRLKSYKDTFAMQHSLKYLK